MSLLSKLSIVIPTFNRPDKVPAYTWHTYVMLSEKNIVYETMEGKYETDSWKRMASWAPAEDSVEAFSYLQDLKNSL